jgi:hypothetical protein
VDTVTNAAAITNGRDLEKDDSYRTRIKAFIRSLSRATIPSLLGAVMNAEDISTGQIVAYAAVVEDPFHDGRVVVYVDDGSGTAEGTPETVTMQQIVLEGTAGVALGGEIDLYLPKPIRVASGYTIYRKVGHGFPTALVENTDYVLNPADGHAVLTPTAFSTGLTAGDLMAVTCTYYTGLIAECQKIVAGDPADRVGYPGYRAGGIRVQVLPPTINSISVVGGISALPGWNPATVATAVGAAISEYVNALGIGEDVILAEIIARAMAVAGVYDIALSEPTENLAIPNDSLARLQSYNVDIV